MVINWLLNELDKRTLRQSAVQAGSIMAANDLGRVRRSQTTCNACSPTHFGIRACKTFLRICAVKQMFPIQIDVSVSRTPWPTD